MEIQVNLDESNWAKIKEVSDLRRIDRRAINAATVFEVDPETKRPIMRASLDDDQADAVLMTVVVNWSLPFPLPSVDRSSLDKLTLEQDDNLREAIQPHIDALKGVKAPAKVNEVPTPASEK